MEDDVRQSVIEVLFYKNESVKWGREYVMRLRI